MSDAAASRPRSRSARRRARELVLQGIYEWLLKDGVEPDNLGAIDAWLREQEGYHEADAEYLSVLFYGAVHQAGALREQFAPHVDRPLTELSPVEHGILLIGSFELVNQVDVPYRVVINEAVELAKAYGGTDGFKFVNGVLDKLAANVRQVEFEARRR